MKYIRKFDSAAAMAAAINSLPRPFVAWDSTTSTTNLEFGEVLPIPPEQIPFYIEDISGSENTIQITKSNNNAPTLTIEKSLDGETWETMGITSTTAITAIIPANGKIYLRCSAGAWGAGNYRNTIITTGNCNVGGNIMSLLYGSNFTGEETTFPSGSIYNFSYLFVGNTYLINASDLLLPATTLTDMCYTYMFQNCSSLTTAPELPATTLADWCYVHMFYGCTSLTVAPVLPATTLTNNCYNSMFYNCTSLTVAPVLPATTLAENCYNSMFQNCRSLTTAPELPATTLANSCYANMFISCRSLGTAPVLPATTLTTSCYYGMFQDCPNLNYIKCLATDISASGCTVNWTYGVAATGTFVKDPNMSGWKIGNGSQQGGIPSGWTVEDAA